MSGMKCLWHAFRRIGINRSSQLDNWGMHRYSTHFRRGGDHGSPSEVSLSRLSSILLSSSARLVLTSLIEGVKVSSFICDMRLYSTYASTS